MLLNRVHITLIPSIIIFVLFVSACAPSVVTHELEYRGSGNFVGKEPIRGPLTLLLTREFEQSYLEGFSYGDIRRFPVGRVLIQNAERMGRALFPDLVVIRADTIPSDTSAPFFLVPKATIHRQMAMMGWSSTVTTVSLEWRLKDRSGETLWVTTVDGKSEGAVGSMFSATKNSGLLLDKALTAAFDQSYDRIGMDREIRNVIESKRRL